jgi:hypothetical protein
MLPVEIRAIKWVPIGSPGNNVRNDVLARIFSLGTLFLTVNSRGT